MVKPTLLLEYIYIFFTYIQVIEILVHVITQQANKCLLSNSLHSFENKGEKTDQILILHFNKVFLCQQNNRNKMFNIMFL